MNTPKKIFVPTRSVHMVDKDLKYFATIPYVRADLVDDLVEALEFLLTCKHGEFCEHYREAERKAKAALAKARGEG